MTLKTFTTILLATAILLFTACDSKVRTDTVAEQNTTVQINNAANTTEGGSIGTTSEENNTGTITLNSLKLTINKTTLKKDENTTLKVMATYSDGTNKEVTESVEWISSQNNAVKVTNHTLKALQDRQTTLQAKLNNVTSEAIILNIYWEVNGYRLPPEPEATVNNSTLLGMDVNDNGVRDDVERYIIKTYKDEKIAIEIGFQIARAYNTVIEDPNNAEETTKVMEYAQDCEIYFTTYAKLYGEDFILSNEIDSKKFKSMNLNTKERIRAYLQYNSALSGGVFTLEKGIKDMKRKCTFDVEQMLGNRK